MWRPRFNGVFVPVCSCGVCARTCACVAVCACVFGVMPWLVPQRLIKEAVGIDAAVGSASESCIQTRNPHLSLCIFRTMKQNNRCACCVFEPCRAPQTSGKNALQLYIKSQLLHFCTFFIFNPPGKASNESLLVPLWVFTMSVSYS